MSMPSRLTTLLFALATAVLFLAGFFWQAAPRDQIAFYLLVLHTGLAFTVVWLRVLGRWPRLLAQLPQWLDGHWWQVALLHLSVGCALLARLAAGDELLASYPRLASGAWVLAITAVLLGAARRDSAPTPTSPRSRYWWLEPVGLGLLTFVALQLRLIALNQFPTTLAGDEGSAGLAAVQFLQAETTNLFTTGWLSFPTLYFAMQSLGILAWGQTIEGLRLTAALAGGLTIPAVYVLGRQTYGKLVGALAATLLAGSHFHIHFSRIGLNNIWDGLFIALILATLWQGWQTGRRQWFLFCGLLLGLSQYFYVSARVFPLLVLVWALIAGAAERDRWRQNFVNLALAALVAAVVYLPLALYFVGHPDIFQAPMNRVTIFDWWLANETARLGVPAWQVMLEQLRLATLGISHEPLRMWYTPEMALLRWPASWLFWLGVGLILLRRELRGLLLGLPLATAVLLGAFSQDTPAAQRYIVICVLAVLVTAVPFGLVADWVRQKGVSWVRTVTAVGVAVVLVVGLADVRFYFSELYDFYILGGANTEVATAVGTYLRQQTNPEQDVYFVGHPRMRYDSHSTIPYLAPKMQGHNLNDPLQAPPAWLLRGDSIFIFLPERADEMSLIQEAFPNGRVQVFDHGREGVLFISYEVSPP